MIEFEKIKAVIWDWNGTLLNDVEPCIASMNVMLQKRDYPLLSTERYKEIFTFPVKDYYLKAGIDLSKHLWDDVAHEFIDLYRQRVIQSPLHEEAEKVLNNLRSAGFRQFILSAMQQEFLLETIRQRISIDVFDKVAGLNNHYAQTKVDVGKKLIEAIDFRNDQLLLIGDTLHDFEVAQALGIGCVLFSGGHQSRGRLEKSGAAIIDSLCEMEQLLLPER